MQKFSPITENEIKQKCEENIFVRSWNSYYAQDGDPMVDVNNEFNVARFETVEELKEAFMTYDVHRQCFVYRNLVFVNSTVGGGWEAWTLKKFGDELVAFESMSMQLIIKQGIPDRNSVRGTITFEQLIEQLLHATKEQCKNLTYGEDQVTARIAEEEGRSMVRP